jgi:hypothetical protein
MQHTKLKVSFRRCFVTAFALIVRCDSEVGTTTNIRCSVIPGDPWALQHGGGSLKSRNVGSGGSHRRTLRNVQVAKYAIQDPCKMKTKGAATR